MACSASAGAFPQASESGPWADLGKAKGLYLRYVGRIGKERALALVPEEFRADCDALDLTGLPIMPEEFVHELAMVVDLKTGAAREISRGTEDRPPAGLGPYECYGRADALGLEDDFVVIPDFKAGNYDKQPDKDPQLLALALAATRIFNKPAAKVSVWSIRHSRPFQIGPVIVDAFALEEFRQRAVDAVEMIRYTKKKVASGQSVRVYEGPWCKYCPSFKFCPAKKALLQRTLDGDLISEKDVVETYHKLLAAEEILAVVKKELQKWARDNGPLRVGPGRLYGEHEKLGHEKVNGRIAAGVLEMVLGEGASLIALEDSVSKAAIGKAIRAHVGKGKISEAEKEVFRLIRDAGGIQRELTTTIGEFDG